ncbi:TIGR02186 family protein [Alphaproteobacteria bacterium]|nr:TIGR02186 family protein [Alphaproteobacteria bacterium]
MKRNNFFKLLIIILFIFFNKHATSQEAYFDLSEKEIQIQTDFNGKEIIIFGIFHKNQDTIISIQGPKKDTRVFKKEKILGFWINTKKVIYKEIPSLFFVSSSSPIKNILNNEAIIKEKLYFDELLVNAITQRDFIEQKNLNKWNSSLIEIKNQTNLYKEYDFKNIEDKLFQTRVFFPSNSIPGNYKINIYQIKNKMIISKKNRIISIKKSGVGEKIYKFAHQQPATYGLLSIVFAILSGLLAATLFRRV